MSDRLVCELALVGHMCFDEVTPYAGTPTVAPGSAVLCGAAAAARVGTRVAVVTRMAPRDEAILAPLLQLGVVVHVIPAQATTYMRVVHPSSNVDERDMYQVQNAGRFRAADMPRLVANQVHLAGVTDREFDLEFVRQMKTAGYRLSADMQSFVRQVDPSTHRIAFRDVAAKREIAGLLDMVKLDALEAGILTGCDDLDRAADAIEEWGCHEIVITRADGVLARVNGRSFWERFSNKNAVGRTGRGDTVFAAYVSRRFDHEPDASLRFAAALVSLKMERTGPFNGTLTDVLVRMETSVSSS